MPNAADHRATAAMYGLDSLAGLMVAGITRSPTHAATAWRWFHVETRPSGSPG